MAEKIVSPGVFTNEIDQSFIPAAIGELGAAIVGPTVKGPVLTPTVVSSFSEFSTIFGDVIESGSDKYQYLTSHTAQEYLRQGGPCTIVRVADADASRATAQVGGAVVGGTAAVFATVDVTIGTTPISDNDTLSIQVGSGTPQVIKFETGLNLPNSASFSSNKAAIYLDNFGGSNAQKAIQIGEAVEVLVDSISGITGAHSDDGVITITADTAETTDSDLTVSTIADANQITVGTATAGVTGVDGTDTTFFTLEVLGDGPTFNNTSSLGTDNILMPLTSSRSNNLFGSGSYGGRPDNVRYEISSRNLSKGTFTLLIRQGDDTTKRKKILETFANLSFDPESNDYILKRIGNQTNTIAVEEGLAYLQPVGEYPNKSKFVRVSAMPDGVKTPNYLDDNGDVTVRYSNSASFFPTVGSGSYGGSFSGANFGAEIQHPFNFYENISATNSQGVKMADSAVAVGASSVGGGYRTALSMLSNKDEYNFNLLFLPGVVDGLSNHSAIITNAIDLCESRTDCFLVLDSSSKTDSVANVVSTVKGRNSSYAATYYPWVQVQDNILGTNRYVPPSVVIAGVYHFNDTVGQPWFAPAGLNRGGIDTAIQAFKKLTQSQRDTLYDANVNPIATFPGQGVTVFGQKTLQKKASALDRVNVRRLLINVKSFIARSSRNLLFEQNTSDLRDQFLNTVNPFLEQVQSNSGLNAFRVVMDETNNTPETIDRNQLIGQIFLQPTRTAEFIVLDFIVQPTGAAFPE